MAHKLQTVTYDKVLDGHVYHFGGTADNYKIAQKAKVRLEHEGKYVRLYKLINGVYCLYWRYK